MKKFLDTNYLKISLYIIFVVVSCILAYRLSSKTDNILPYIYAFFKNITDILAPIIYGLLIAYLMNPAMGFFERHLVRVTKPTQTAQYKHIRIFSIIIVYICLFGTVFLTVRFLVPQILENIKVLLNNLPNYINEITLFITQLEGSINESLSPVGATIQASNVLNAVNVNPMLSLDSLNNLLNTIIASSLNITGILLDWVIGFVIGIYALNQKETFANGMQRMLYAGFKQHTATTIIRLSKETHEMVLKFFVGKSLDSLIIGIMCYIGLSFMNNPYALLLALIVGVCNMIPYFGPFIGAVPAVILTLFEGFNPALWVALFILLLQQFDGLILGPKILGDSIGLSPFWIITAITIGGALWGPLGMFFASPILAVILSCINRWINTRLLSKSISMPELDTDHFIPNIKSPQAKLNLPFSRKKSKK
ncbi:MAG: AI-2E family transporter [Cellulosilyticaceae bacterium]